MDTNTEVKKSLPRVSILMLTYNRAHFIGEAISSVLGQTYPEWELVIIDDGSIDNTEAVVASFADQRIRYIKHTENAGLFVRRRESLNYADGKYTAILDSDDFWTSCNKIAEQVTFLGTHNDHVVVGTMTKLINGDGKEIGQCSFAVNDSSIREKILRRNQFTHSSILIQTEALKKTTGYQPTLAEDLELILELGNFGALANLPKQYTAHRVHGASENDHGIKMALAVNRIILKHAKNYPNALFARIISSLRIIRGYIKDFFSHKSL